MNVSRWITFSFRSWLGAMCLSLIVACGGGDGSDPVIPSRAGSADIGAAGGSVDAVLEGGTMVTLVVPAGALAKTASLRVDPVAAPDGTFGGFTISPADIVLKAPVTLVVTLSPATHLDADATLAFDTGTVRLPANTTVDLASRTLTVRLSALPATAISRPASSTAGRAHAFASGPVSIVAFAIVRMDYATRLAVLGVVANNLAASGSDDNAIILQLVMDAVLSDSRGATEPDVHVAAVKWASVVCAQQHFSISALDTFAGVDIQSFEQRAKDVFIWDRNALALNATVARLTPAEAGCPGVPADFAEPVRVRLPGFLADMRHAMDLLDPNSAADLDQLFKVRFSQLLDLAFDLGALGFLDLENDIAAVVFAQLDSVRTAAYASCRNNHNQKLQAQLISALRVDPRTNALAPQGWDERIALDVQFCGMALHWQVVDAQGTVLQQGDAGGIGPDVTVTAVTLDLSGAAKVVVSGPLGALVCPLSSQNNEQLVFDAGPLGAPPTSEKRLTPSNANGYLESSSLDFDVATLQTQGAKKLEIARQGGFCSGDFSLLAAHATIATFSLDAGAPRITTSSLPHATLGAGYSAALAATGVTPPLTWSATGLPAGLSLNAGSGEISGTPAGLGISTVAIRVRDADGATAQITLGLTVDAPLTVDGRYVGTHTDNTTGATNPTSTLVTQSGDLVLIGGFLCRLSASGGLSYLGNSRGGFVVDPTFAVTQSFTGQFAGTTLTFRLVDLIPSSNGSRDDDGFVLVKQ